MMEISLKQGSVRDLKTACIAVAVFAGKRLSPSAYALDKASRGALGRVIKRGDITGTLGESLLLPDVTGIGAERVLLVGAGKADGILGAEYLTLLGKTAKSIADAGFKSATSTLGEIEVKDHEAKWKARQAVVAFRMAAYRFD
ncbi:MAG: M17 family peptidase N-terminal domain-containing protein, partial [Gammaproteobacteria bacterium]